MDFGKAIGTACSSFAITNIDDLFVLVTFFAEASSPNSRLSATKIAIGQFLGFSVIIGISMIGYGVAFVLPAEPIGFLGLLPMLLGVWKILGLVLPKSAPADNSSSGSAEDSDTPDSSSDDLTRTTLENTSEDTTDTDKPKPSFASTFVAPTLKVTSITLLNGTDNIGTYTPLFSQAKGAEIAVYIITYYILLSLWILIASLIMRQRHILKIAQRFAARVVPFLYIGLGIFIVVRSECYGWSMEKIDEREKAGVGEAALGVGTTVFMVGCIGVMGWIRWQKSWRRRRDGDAGEEERGDVSGGRDEERLSTTTSEALTLPVTQQSQMNKPPILADSETEAEEQKSRKDAEVS